MYNLPRSADPVNWRDESGRINCINLEPFINAGLDTGSDSSDDEDGTYDIAHNQMRLDSCGDKPCGWVHNVASVSTLDTLPGVWSSHRTDDGGQGGSLNGTEQRPFPNIDYLSEFDDLEVLPNELELHELVGSGSFAEVFRATWCCREVAVKWPSRDAYRDQLALAREVKALASVDHTNVLKLFGVVSSSIPVYIITEYCAWGSCFDLFHQDATSMDITWPQVGKICTDVAEAMQYLHEFSPMIIHRDLKSQNALLARPVNTRTAVPLVKVSDFGLARMKDGGPDAEWSKMTQGVGTAHWMAPEVMANTNYDEKADIYSYAMFMHEAVYRRIPFDGKTPLEVQALVRAGERPPLDATTPDCPGALVALMQSCWNTCPSHRPAARELVGALRAIPQLQHRVAL